MVASTLKFFKVNQKKPGVCLEKKSGLMQPHIFSCSDRNNLRQQLGNSISVIRVQMDWAGKNIKNTNTQPNNGGVSYVPVLISFHFPFIYISIQQVQLQLQFPMLLNQNGSSNDYQFKCHFPEPQKRQDQKMPLILSSRPYPNIPNINRRYESQVEVALKPNTLSSEECSIYTRSIWKDFISFLFL